MHCSFTSDKISVGLPKVLDSKINSSSLAPKKQIIIENNFYRILKAFSNIINKYNFINNIKFKVTENIGDPTYTIGRSNTLSQNDYTNNIQSIMIKNQPNIFEDFIENNKRVKASFSIKKEQL